MSAIQYFKLRALRTLLAVDGIDVNAVNNAGKTALQLLLHDMYGHDKLEMEKLLKAAGAT